MGTAQSKSMAKAADAFVEEMAKDVVQEMVTSIAQEALASVPQVPSPLSQSHTQDVETPPTGRLFEAKAKLSAAKRSSHVETPTREPSTPKAPFQTGESPKSHYEPKSRRGRPRKNSTRRSAACAAASQAYGVGGIAAKTAAFHAERDYTKKKLSNDALKKQRRRDKSKRERAHELSKAEEMEPAVHSGVPEEVRRTLQHSTGVLKWTPEMRKEAKELRLGKRHVPKFQRELKAQIDTIPTLQRRCRQVNSKLKESRKRVDVGLREVFGFTEEHDQAVPKDSASQQKELIRKAQIAASFGILGLPLELLIDEDLAPPRKKSKASGKGAEFPTHFIRSFLSRSLNKGGGYRGPGFIPLRNEANWCFANAAVQALLACDEVRDWAKTATPHCSAIRRSLKDLAERHEAGRSFRSNTRAIRQAVDASLDTDTSKDDDASEEDESEYFMDGSQHDSAEFLEELLCAEKDLYDMFSLVVEETRVCDACGTTSHSKCNFPSIPLKRDGSSIISWEELISSNSVDQVELRCDVCVFRRHEQHLAERHRSDSRHTVTRQLRFGRSSSSNRLLLVNLPRFNAHDQVNPETRVTGFDADSVEMGPHRFKVMAAVIHEGQTPVRGHYMTLTRQGSRWLLKEDDVGTLQDDFLSELRDGDDASAAYLVLQRQL